MSNKPQTTRNRLQGIYTSDKGQIIFVDTPGIHKPKHLLGEYMVSVSERSLAEVDLVYYVVDVTQKFGGGEQYIIDQLQNLQTPVFLILNKIDLVSEEMLQQVQREFTDKMRFAEIIPFTRCCASPKRRRGRAGCCTRGTTTPYWTRNAFAACSPDTRSRSAPPETWG